MDIYLAAPFSFRRSLWPMAASLTQEGHTITSHWIYHVDVDPALQPYDVHRRIIAEADLRAIEESQLLIHFGSENVLAAPGFGSHFEAGYAAAIGVDVIAIKPAHSLFVEGFPGLTLVDNWVAALTLIRAIPTDVDSAHLDCPY